MERHVERFKDLERLERVRVGIATAAIMNTGMAQKADKTAWKPWDVFPELQPEVDTEAELSESKVMFRRIAARQRTRKEENG